MANTLNPTGFELYTVHMPAPPIVKTFVKLVGEGAALFQNDVVEGVASSSLTEGKSGIKAFATPGTSIPLGTNLGPPGAASTKTRHSVCLADLRTEFHAQDDGDTDGVGATELDLNANVSLGAGSSTTGFSKHAIDEASIANTATLDLQLLGLWPGQNNAVGSKYVRMICKFNKGRGYPATART